MKTLGKFKPRARVDSIKKLAPQSAGTFVCGKLLTNRKLSRWRWEKMCMEKHRGRMGIHLESVAARGSWWKAIHILTTNHGPKGHITWNLDFHIQALADIYILISSVISVTTKKDRENRRKRKVETAWYQIKHYTNISQFRMLLQLPAYPVTWKSWAKDYSTLFSILQFSAFLITLEYLLNLIIFHKTLA